MYNKRELRKSDRKAVKSNPWVKDKAVIPGAPKVDSNGYWDPSNIGRQVEISSNRITMTNPDGSPLGQDLIGVGKQTGNVQYMQDGMDYIFYGDQAVIEHPKDEFMYLDGREIKAYRDGGYIVEELPQAQPGGHVSQATHLANQAAAMAAYNTPYLISPGMMYYPSLGYAKPVEPNLDTDLSAYLKSVDQPNSYEDRKKLYESTTNKTDYKGTADQNIGLLKLVKEQSVSKKEVAPSTNTTVAGGPGDVVPPIKGDPNYERKLKAYNRYLEHVKTIGPELAEKTYRSTTCFDDYCPTPDATVTGVPPEQNTNPNQKYVGTADILTQDENGNPVHTVEHKYTTDPIITAPKKEEKRTQSRGQTVMKVDPNNPGKYIQSDIRQVPYSEYTEGKGWSPVPAPRVMWINPEGQEVEIDPRKTTAAPIIIKQKQGGYIADETYYPPKHNPANSFAVNDPRSMSNGGRYNDAAITHYEDGGYSYADLTDEEISQYRRGGFVIDELHQAQDGETTGTGLTADDYYNNKITSEKAYNDYLKKIETEKARVAKVKGNIIPAAQRLDAADNAYSPYYIDEWGSKEEQNQWSNYINAKDPKALAAAKKALSPKLKSLIPAQGNYNVAKWDAAKNDWYEKQQPDRELYCTPYGCFAYQNAGAYDVPTIGGNVDFASGAASGKYPFEKINPNERQPGDMALLREMSPIDYTNRALGNTRRPHHTTIYSGPGKDPKDVESMEAYNANNGERLLFGLDEFKTDEEPADAIDYYRYVGQMPKYEKEAERLKQEKANAARGYETHSVDGNLLPLNKLTPFPTEEQEIIRQPERKLEEILDLTKNKKGEWVKNKNPKTKKLSRNTNRYSFQDGGNMDPGNNALELHMFYDKDVYKKEGGALLTKKVTCKNCGWTWDAADGGDDVTTCHKCGGQGMVHAENGGGLPKAQYAGTTFNHPDAGATNVLFQKPVATKPNSKYDKKAPVNYQEKLKPVVADNTRDVTADQTLAAVQNAAYMESPEYKAKQKAEKEAQAKFEKEQWDKYNKMSFSEKVSDRTNAALNQWPVMLSNTIAGKQAYIPGMASGLGDGGPDYDKWLKATGQTRGLSINDAVNAFNPGNWGGHAGREYGEGNYLTGAGELGLGLLGLKGAPLMGNELAKRYATNLIELEKLGTPIKNYASDFYQTSKQAGKPKLPTYKSTYRVEPTDFKKDEWDDLSGRWFVDNPEDANFYVKNLKSDDPNASVRIMKEKMLQDDYAKQFGENMPDAAKEMSIGTGAYESIDDLVAHGKIDPFTALNWRTNNLTQKDFRDLSLNKFAYNKTEGILNDAYVQQLRDLSKNNKFARSSKFEFPDKYSATGYLREQQEGLKKNKFKEKYLPFEEGGSYDSENDEGEVGYYTDKEIAQMRADGYIVKEE